MTNPTEFIPASPLTLALVIIDIVGEHYTLPIFLGNPTERIILPEVWRPYIPIWKPTKIGRKRDDTVNLIIFINKNVFSI